MALSDDAMNRLVAALASEPAAEEIAAALGGSALAISDDASNRINLMLGSAAAGEDFLANLLAAGALTSDDTINRISTALGSAAAALELVAAVAQPVAPTMFGPLDQTTSVGAATFQVFAFGTLPLVFQWQRSFDNVHWTNILSSLPSGLDDGITYTNWNKDTLLIAGATAPQNGWLYRCLVSNTAQNNVPSRAALLTVPAGPAIAGPTNQVDLGQGVIFSITATGTVPFTYQWERSTDGTTWGDITSGNAASLDVGVTYRNWDTNRLSMTGATAAQNGNRYRCFVRNAYGSLNSSAATYTYGVAPAITSQPGNESTAGGGTTFNIGATGTPSPLYQWQRSVDGITYVNITSSTPGALDAGVTYTGQTTNALMLSGASVAENNFWYRCVVSNGVLPNATSTAAQLTFVN